MKIGMDLGGNHVAIGVVDKKGKIIEKNEKDFKDRDILKIKKVLTKFILENIGDFSKKYEIELVGISAPGTPRDGKLTTLNNLGIDEYDITKIINKYYSLPITIKNDGNAAGLGELKYGSLKNYKDCIFLCLGTGIGGAAFIKGKEMAPIRNSGMEIGHMIIDKNGVVCTCGKKGCFETYCSIKRLKNNFIEILNLPKDISSKKLLNIMTERQSDEKVRVLLDDYIDNLIIGLSNIIDIFEPQAICFGGSFVFFKDILFSNLEKRFYEEKYVFNKKSLPKIVLAELGNDAGIIGATCKN